MPGKERDWLEASIRSLLVPDLQRRGFSTVALTGDEQRSEIGRDSPFGRFRRGGSRGIEMVEIQLDKHGAASFRLNLGIAPPGGFIHPIGGKVEEDDVWVQYLSRWYELLPRPRFPLFWFAVWRWLGQSSTQGDYEVLVEKVVKLMPEIDDLFREGKQGPHIRRVEGW